MWPFFVTLNICNTVCLSIFSAVPFNGTVYSPTHYIPPREIGENVQCGNAHNEHNERGGESMRRMYPLPLSLSLALHSSGGGYLGQGNKGHQLLISLQKLQQPFSKIYFLSDFSETLG